ncbi:MAG: helix-turn-helix transcriptional regulator [Ruminococcus sp.]|nr:helix-turn-helix transcriptional regulator [Ruminococcus sp.]
MLSENIKKLREARNLSQVQLANALFVTKQSVSNWENGNIMPSVEILEKIADYFFVTTDFLLGRNNKEYIDPLKLNTKEIAHIKLLINDLNNQK